jgi:hypothetical protein
VVRLWEGLCGRCCCCCCCCGRRGHWWGLVIGDLGGRGRRVEGNDRGADAVARRQVR